MRFEELVKCLFCGDIVLHDRVSEDCLECLLLITMDSGLDSEILYEYLYVADSGETLREFTYVNRVDSAPLNHCRSLNDGVREKIWDLPVVGEVNLQLHMPHILWIIIKNIKNLGGS